MVNKAKRRSGIDPLTYMGIEPITAPLLIVETRIPTTDDRALNQIGAKWVVEETDTVAGRVFALVRLEGSGPSGTATWKELDSGFGGETFQTDNGVAIPAANILNIIGGTSTGGVAINMNTRGAGNTVEVNLDNSIFQPDTTGIATGVYGLGGSADANRFMHNFGTNNTFLGKAAGNFTLTGNQNVGISRNSLIALTTGSSNVAIGAFSQQSNLTGIENLSLGTNSLIAETSGARNIALGDGAIIVQDGRDDNIAIGVDSLGGAVAADGCIAIGSGSMGAYTGADTNEPSIAIGFAALESATNNVRMIAIGHNALNAGQGTDTIAIGHNAIGVGVLTGIDNIMIGNRAGLNQTSGNNNVTVGNNTLAGSTVGSSNVIIGHNANTVGNPSSNVVIGFMANNSDLTGSTNTIIGFRAMELATNNNTNVVAIGHRAAEVLNGGTQVVAIGTNALGAATTGHSGSVAIGHHALFAATTGTPNIAIGLNSMGTGVVTGSFNIALGAEVLGACTAGADNVAIGRDTMLLYQGDGRDDNIAIGDRALANVVQCNDNIAIGAQSLENNVSAAGDGRGSSNIAIGDRSLNLLNPAGATDSGFNVSIGVQSLALLVTGSENISLGHLSGSALTTSDSDNILIGNVGVAGDAGEIRIGTLLTHLKNFQSGIHFVTTDVVDAIPVLVDSAGQLGTTSSSARYKNNIRDMSDDSDAVMKLRPVTFTYKKDEEKRLQYGLIAEEVEDAMPLLVSYNNDGQPEAVRYHDLPAILLNELQKMEKRLKRLESKACSSCTHDVG